MPHSVCKVKQELLERYGDPGPACLKTSMSISVAALSGSLPAQSYNTKLVRAFQERAPNDVQVETIDISRLPLFNEDLEGGSLPETVRSLMRGRNVSK
jgi:hypothetical protein